MTGNPFDRFDTVQADDGLINAVIMAESSGRADAVSSKGARGPMQLMPGTAADLGVDPDNPFDNIEGGSRYLSQMLAKYGGDKELALMAYNWGPGNVDRWIAGGRAGPVPQETRGYLSRVLGAISPISVAQAQETPNAFDAFDEGGNPFDQFDGANPFDQFDERGVIGNIAEGARAGIRSLGQQGSTLYGLATGEPAAPPPVEEFDRKYADVPFFQKLTDPTWLAHFIPQTVVGSAPFLAGAGAGAAAGAPLGPVGALIGAMIGGGTASGFQSLADAYNEALRAGKDHDTAVDYAMKQGAVSAGLDAATVPLGLWGVAKGPVSYVLKQMVAQPAGSAATQGAANIIAKMEGVDPERDVTAGMPEAALGAGVFQAPVTAKAVRSVYQAGKRVGELPPESAPSGEGPQAGQRFVLGLEESTADPETGQTAQTVTPSDVTVQGYDPETGLVTLTRDSDGAQLGPMSLDDFTRLRRPEEPGPIPEPVAERAVTPTEEDIAVRDAALATAEDRGFAEDSFHRPMKPIKEPEPITAEEIARRDAELRAAEEAGLAQPVEAEGKRPFFERAPVREEPELPLGDEETQLRVAHEQEVAEEADRRAFEADPEREAIQEVEAHDVRRTPEGAYELTDKQGEPLGYYPSKKAAKEASRDRVRTDDTVDVLRSQASEQQDAAAKTYAEKTPKGKIPDEIGRMADALESRGRMRMKDLGTVEAKAILPRTLAMMDRPFARLYKPVQKREEAQTRNYRDFFWQAKPLGRLTKPSRDQVYRAAVIARLQSRNIVPSGAKLVLKNGENAITDPDTGKVWVKPNETIRLTKEETEGYFALKAAMQNVWGRYIEAVTRNIGYTGDLKALREATKSEAAGKAFIEASDNPGIARKALDLAMTLGAQERAGYISLQRRGDVMLTVMPNVSKEMKTSAGDLGGEVKPLWVEFVDTDTLGKQVKGRKFSEGDYGPQVKKRIAELKKRFPDAKVMLPRYISEVRQEELSIPALDKLVSGLANKNPDLRDSIYNEFLSNVYENAKSGFRKKSGDIPGFSTDFDRMVTEYLHHTARVLPMIEHRNEVAAARQRLMEGDKAKKIPPEGSRSVRNFAQRWLEYVDDPGGDFSAIRKVGFGWWLWASPSSAIINLTQTPLVTIAGVGKWGGYARAILEANKIASTLLLPNRLMFKKSQWSAEGGKINLDIDNLRLPEKEKALLRGWERDGTLQAQVTSDMLGNNIGKSPAFRPMAKMAQKAYEAGASVFGAAEVTNRAIAGLSAYRLALQPGALEKARRLYKDNQLFQEQFGNEVTPENLAKWAILETQFQGGKINAPELMRGIGAPLTQFKKFTGNYLSLLYRQFRYEGAPGKVAGTMMLGALIGAAGIKGLPFVQDLMEAVDWATELATGINPQVEMQIKRWLRDGLTSESTGEDWSRIGTEMLLNGPSRYLTGMDMGQRFGQGDLVPNNPFDVLGPVAGAIAQAYDASSLSKVGQKYQAAEKRLPKAVGNVVGAMGLQEQGITTKAGNRVMMPSEFTDADVAKKAMGFQPAELARKYEDIFDLSKIDADARKATAGFYRKLALSVSLAEDARAQGDRAKADRYMARFQEDMNRYLKNIEDPKRPEYMKFRMSRETLKKEIANALDWSRRFAKGTPRQARPEIMRLMEQMGRSVGEFE